MALKRNKWERELRERKRFLERHPEVRKCFEKCVQETHAASQQRNSLRLEPADEPFQEHNIDRVLPSEAMRMHHPHHAVNNIPDKQMIPYRKNAPLLKCLTATKVPRPLPRIQASLQTGTFKPMVAIIDGVFLETID